VLEVEVDGAHVQALQACVAGLGYVLRAAVDSRGPVRLAKVAELGGEHDLVAAAAQGPAQQLLVLAPAVHVGGVEEVHAEVERTVDDRDGLLLVALAVDVGHGHAAEADRGNGQRALAECASLHEFLLRNLPKLDRIRRPILLQDRGARDPCRTT
jgi:hypothetical protein